MNIFDVRENLDTIVFDHDQQIKDLAAHLLELKQLVTPMMEFKQPTKICGPNLEETLNAAGFYRKKEWVGITKAQLKLLREGIEEEAVKTGDSIDWILYTNINEILKRWNS